MRVVCGMVEFAFVAIGVEDTFPFVRDQNALIPFTLSLGRSSMMLSSLTAID